MGEKGSKKWDLQEFLPLQVHYLPTHPALTLTYSTADRQIGTVQERPREIGVGWVSAERDQDGMRASLTMSLEVSGMLRVKYFHRNNEYNVLGPGTMCSLFIVQVIIITLMGQTFLATVVEQSCIRTWIRVRNVRVRGVQDPIRDVRESKGSNTNISNLTTSLSFRKNCRKNKK